MYRVIWNNSVRHCYILFRCTSIASEKMWKIFFNGGPGIILRIWTFQLVQRGLGNVFTSWAANFTSDTSILNSVTYVISFDVKTYRNPRRTNGKSRICSGELRNLVGSISRYRKFGKDYLWFGTSRTRRCNNQLTIFFSVIIEYWL